MLVSVVIPCYNSQNSISGVVDLTRDTFAHLSEYECEFILVNDGSADGTFGVIKELAVEYPEVHGINLMRNFGQHNALICGMNYANGEYVLGMDDDYQTHPSQINKILEKMSEGYDLVYGVYGNTSNGIIKNATSAFNRITSRILLERPHEIESSNFWCVTRDVCSEIIKYKGFSPYIDGLFYRTTHNIGNVQIEHHRREHGESGYSLKKLAKLWLAYFNYSVVPLRIASVVGMVTAFFGFAAGLITVVRKLLDPSVPMGWTSTISIMLFLAGLILLVLGIIGEYIGDIALSLSNTPQYVVREKVNL